MTFDSKFRPTGFTLMEMLIATALFALTVTLASVLFLRTTREETRSKNIQAVQSDLRFTLEKMSQDVRLASLDYEYYRNPGAAKDANKNKPWQDDTGRIFLDRTGVHSGNLVNRIQILALRDASYNQIFYAYNASSEAIETCTNVYGGESAVETDRCEDPNDWEQITPDRSNIRHLEFIVTPTTDPYFQPISENDCLDQSSWNATIGRCICNNGGNPDPTQCWIGDQCEGTKVNGVMDYFCQAPDQNPQVTIVIEGVSTEYGGSKDAEEVIRLQTTSASRIYQR